MVKQTINQSLQIRGFYQCIVQNNFQTSICDLAQHFENKLFKVMIIHMVVIPRNVKLAESPSFGKPIMLYDTNQVEQKHIQI